MARHTLSETIGKTVAGRRPYRYGVAVLALALSVACYAAFPFVAQAPGNSALLLLLAVILSAWYGGFGPGALVTVVVAVVTASPEPEAWRVGRLVMFVTEGILISVSMESLHSARRRMEKSEDRMRSLFEGTADAIFSVDEAGTIREVNRAAERIFGHPAPVLIGKGIDVVLPGASPGAGPAAAGLGLRRDGSMFPVEVTVGGFRHDGQRYVSVVARDVTVRKQAEDAARESAELLRIVTDTARVGLVMLDEGRRYLHANRAYISMLGLSDRDLVGRRVADVLAPVYEGQIRPRLDRAFRGERVTYELRYAPAGGEPGGPRFYRVDYEPHVDPSGVTRVVVVLVETTLLRRVETAFKENEGRLGLFIEHAPAAIAMFDREMRYIAASRRWLSDYRLGDQKLIGRCHYDVFPDLPERWKEAHRRALSGEVIGSNEDLFVQEGGDELWVRWEVRPWLNALGEIGGIVIAALDITERKRAELANARLAAIVDSSEDAIVGKDLDGVITSWNGAAERLFGYTAEEAVGRSVTMLIPTDRLDEETLILGRVRSGMPVEHYETVRRRKDGRLVDVSLTVSPVRDADGRIIGASKIARDITERKRAVDELRRHALLLDQAFDPILAWELEGPITYWNEGATRLYGFTAQEALGRECQELLQTVFPVGFDDFRESLRERGRWEGELRHRTRDLGWVTVDSRMTVVPRPDRQQWVLESNRDVTQRKRAEEGLRRTSERLEALSRQLLRAQEDERRRIARELHDEIGQALTALKINLQEVVGGGDARARLVECVEIVDHSLEQVRGMALDLRPSVLDDLGLVAALKWYVTRYSNRTGLSGRFFADPEDLRADPEIETACFRVTQEALTNIARHARATRFSVELLRHSRGLHLTVRDDGVGFDFEAAARSASEGKSAGVQGMVERAELAGGRLSFESHPGGGTELHFEFPDARPGPG